MALYRRLLGLDEPKIPVHAFMAACAELSRGRGTLAAFYAAFGLDAGEQTEMQTLAARVGAGVTANELHDVLLLGEGRVAYVTEASLKTRLGV